MLYPVDLELNIDPLSLETLWVNIKQTRFI